MFLLFQQAYKSKNVIQKRLLLKLQLTDLCGYERFLSGLNTCCRLTSQSCYVQVYVDWQITTDMAVSD